MKKRSLLTTCLLLSLSVHLFFLFFFARTPLLLQNRFASLFRKNTPPMQLLTADEEELLRQQELEEVFEQLASPGPTPFDFYHQPAGHIKPPAQEGIAALPSILEEKESTGFQNEEILSALSTPSLASEIDAHLSLEDDSSEPGLLTQIKFDKTASIDHKKELASGSLALDAVETIDDLGMNSLAISCAFESKLPSTSTVESFLKTSTLDKPATSNSLLEQKTLTVEQSQESETLGFALPQPPGADLQKPFQFQKPSSLPQTSDYLLPEISSSLPWDEAFDVKVELMSDPEGKGVVFSLNLTPTDEIHMEAMTHNIYFLIDRSSSIQKHRFAAYKRAVLKALSCLHEGDKFNILFFDKKIKRLSDRPLPFSKANYQRAEEFLGPQEQGGVFAAADLYSALDKITPSTITEGEAHSAILISDGDSSQSPAKQQKQISDWLAKNGGKVTLYTAAVGKENNLVMLDLLSSASGGYLLYSDTYAAFPRKLGKLLLDLRSPLVKDLMVTAQPKDGSSTIVLHSPPTLPTLFAKRPYELVGKASSVQDFTLMIQGKYKDQWVTITKEVSLKQAAKGSRLLQKKWANVKAKNQYESFLKEGKVAHLLKAKEILKSSGHEIALE